MSAFDQPPRDRQGRADVPRDRNCPNEKTSHINLSGVNPQPDFGSVHHCRQLDRHYSLHKDCVNARPDGGRDAG
ncbi:hypothetical protein H6F43_13655 [Leptolyngbya sp. FACHB-36]|uniref:hypothetical protein n=1 Tax=Leptolyngbya sp. FACHB-36 TaxID=2692808 RepID=UPI0016817F13|nr:hypothetical protein [Leptolyngbya sp. FACHB-36]MBD2021223.1 hypothetical protein [Leptolyngbya sp. FACHB-36]